MKSSVLESGCLTTRASNYSPRGQRCQRSLVAVNTSVQLTAACEGLSDMMGGGCRGGAAPPVGTLGLVVLSARSRASGVGYVIGEQQAWLWVGFRTRSVLNNPPAAAEQPCVNDLATLCLSVSFWKKAPETHRSSYPERLL